MPWSRSPEDMFVGSVRLRRMRPRIAVLTERFGGLGGGERFSHEVTRRLAASGRYEMHVFCWRRGAETHTDCPTITFHHVPRLKFPRFMRPLLFNWVAQRRMRRGRFDLIHSHQPTWRADVFSTHSAPHVHWMERILQRRPQPIDRVMMRIDQRMIAGGTDSIFMPVSSFLHDRYRERFSPLLGEWRVVPPGVDYAHFLHDPRARTQLRAQLSIPVNACALLFVGMNFKTKGLRLLIDALALAPKHDGCERMRLIVVGRGDAAPFRAQAQQLGVGDCVHFVGAVPDTAPWYSAADAFALLSDFETFGMVVAEAMAAGLPVLVTDQMGARDLVAGSGAGAVMESPTAASVAQQLALLADPAARASMGAAARARAESLTWERTTAAIAQAYDEVLARR